MREVYRTRLTRDQIFTVPNFMSFSRLLMIPVIVFLFFRCESRVPATCVLLLSVLTDLLDGYVARRTNRVTDLGKLLDPIADKATQAALIVCLLSVYPQVAALLVLLLFKEGFQFWAGLRLFRREGRMDGAHWYGKLSTAVLFGTMTVLFVFRDLPGRLVFCAVCLCGAVMLVSAVGYGSLFLGHRTPEDGDG